ncbi:hypothetical protein [Flavobacterium aurantiibacter]|uniref:Uncharacterized protein n=1 Tax=Flavobacterium aurantiibacter TaxID=2023067 RepID=A0A256ADH0_9FLAO|nr:hypothetical protein [Flavobacterium aurantiibacter]OYQ51255.1 hypothetical protein CHX27_00400 [Flavobacterium aurantiibacter]
MKMFNYILICFLLLSCQNKEQKRVKNSINNSIQQSESNDIVKDTTIVYDIDNVSAEGVEATVRYVNKKIKESTINIYGETGQATITYLFSSDLINVTEKVFEYKTDLKKVSSDKDMKIKTEVSYNIDLEGRLIGVSGKERIDIFKEFKEVVPFEIN